MDLRANPGATVARVASEKGPVFLSRRGRTCAVLLSIDAYDALLSGERADVGETDQREQPPRPLRLEVSAGTVEDASRVLAAIEAGRGANPDELVQATGLSVPRVLIALTDLQVNGFVDPPGRDLRK